MEKIPVKFSKYSDLYETSPDKDYKNSAFIKYILLFNTVFFNSLVGRLGVNGLL